MKTFSHIVRIDWDIRSNKDRRRRVDSAIVSYTGGDGYEYRKAFEFTPGMSYDSISKLIPGVIE